LRSTADGVIFLFFSAGPAGGAMRIAVIHAAGPETLRTKVKHRENIARPKRGKRTTGKQKTAVDIV